MRLTDPLFLLLLLLIPAAVAGYVWLERRRSRYAIHFTNIDVLASAAEGSPRWRRLVPPVLIALTLLSAGIAVARPQARLSERKEEASIALVLDVSRSMEAVDVRPSRLEAAKRAVVSFIDKVPDKYRVGLVTFAGEPFVAAPLSHDREPINESLRVGIVPGYGTAIGDALGRAVEVLRPVAGADDQSLSQAQPQPRPREPADPDDPLSAILLLSDGSQRGGILQPQEGAARAKSYGIPVYTIALGTDGGTLDGFGGSFSVPPDRTTLRQIARATGGEYFDSRSEDNLRAVYEGLASRLGTRKVWREVGNVLLGIAVLFALCAGATSLLWVHRVR